MSFLSEVKMAVEEIGKYNKQLVLLQCTANYPIKDSEANLNIIKTYQDHFDVQVGYSDHSVGIGASPYAIPLGVTVVEKHFTLNKEEAGPDHLASLNPNELIAFVKEIRKVEEYMGSFIKKPSFAEQKTRASLQKCLVASKPIRKGEPFGAHNITGKRTGGTGISPVYYKDVYNQEATRDFDQNEIIDV